MFFLQCGTVLGEPNRVVNLGETFIPYQVFLDYVLGLGESTFRLVQFLFISPSITFAAFSSADFKNFALILRPFFGPNCFT